MTASRPWGAVKVLEDTTQRSALLLVAGQSLESLGKDGVSIGQDYAGRTATMLSCRSHTFDRALADSAIHGRASQPYANPL